MGIPAKDCSLFLVISHVNLRCCHAAHKVTGQTVKSHHSVLHDVFAHCCRFFVWLLTRQRFLQSPRNSNLSRQTMMYFCISSPDYIGAKHFHKPKTQQQRNEKHYYKGGKKTHTTAKSKIYRLKTGCCYWASRARCWLDTAYKYYKEKRTGFGNTSSCFCYQFVCLLKYTSKQEGSYWRNFRHLTLLWPWPCFVFFDQFQNLSGNLLITIIILSL